MRKMPRLGAKEKSQSSRVAVHQRETGERRSFFSGMSGLTTVCHDISRNRKTIVT